MNNYFMSNLKYIREKRGMTQTELGKIINVNQTTIARWEEENRIPSIDKAIDVSVALGIPLNELIGTDLRLKKEAVKQSKFHYKDKESGLSVEIVLPKNIDWDKLPKEEREEYINQAMDFLYETKRNMKKGK